MVLISLVFLFVYLFGAYAYGAAMVFSLRRISKVWNRHAEDGASAETRRIDWPSMALLTISTVWFVLHTLIEFRQLTGDSPQNDLLDLGTLMVFLFPPVIMHTVYRESHSDGEPAPIFRYLLTAMYVVAPALGLLTVAMIFRLLPRPDNFGSWIGGSIGGLFILASLYSTVLMLRRQRRPRTPDQLRLRNVMIFLFVVMGGVFVALLFMNEQTLGMAVLGGFTRTTPIYFLIASVYFENRFEFYDLVVKRAIMILLSVFVLGVYFAIVLSSLELLPGGAARPWLFAVALAPVAMIMPALVARVERWLDRMWLGREFIPVEAVKHVLAAMQPAIDEASLVAATEARLSEIFGTQIVVRVGHEPAGDAAAVIEVPSPVSSLPVRIVVLRGHAVVATKGHLRLKSASVMPLDAAGTIAPGMLRLRFRAAVADELLQRLAAEHGAWRKKRSQQWTLARSLSCDWKPKLSPMMIQYADRLPGAFVEEKEYSLVWHYRRADSEQGMVVARELMDDLLLFTGNIDVKVVQGNKTVEVRSLGLAKSLAARSWLRNGEFDFILAIGDDHDDEELFGVLPQHAYAIRVGITQTAARFNLREPKEVVMLLEALTEAHVLTRPPGSPSGPLG